MSYSGGTGKSFGNRGSSSRGKEKKKKQEFHKHRLKFVAEEHASIDQLKERVSIGLQKLGSQVFSTEPGGYGFQNWMTSFNLLLDDFEEKCNPASLPKEYYDERLKLTSQLMEPVDTAAQDSEKEKLESEIASREEKIGEIAHKSERVAVEDWREDDVKIARLKRERSQNELDSTSARTKLDEEKKKANQSVYKRLFSRSDTLKPLQANLDSLAARREEIDEKLRLLGQDRTAKQSEAKKFGSDISELRSNLEELRLRLGEVEAQKLDAMQISERRSNITKSMVEMIASLHLGDQQTPDEEAKE